MVSPRMGPETPQLHLFLPPKPHGCTPSVFLEHPLPNLNQAHPKLERAAPEFCAASMKLKDTCSLEGKL